MFQGDHLRSAQARIPKYLDEDPHFIFAPASMQTPALATVGWAHVSWTGGIPGARRNGVQLTMGPRDADRPDYTHSRPASHQERPLPCKETLLFLLEIARCSDLGVYGLYRTALRCAATGWLAGLKGIAARTTLDWIELGWFEEESNRCRARRRSRPRSTGNVACTREEALPSSRTDSVPVEHITLFPSPPSACTTQSAILISTAWRWKDKTRQEQEQDAEIAWLWGC